MSDNPAEAVNDALTGLRRAVRDQLGVERPPPADVDPDSLVRFSPDLPRQLDPAERERLAVRVAELDPWLQGPFLLGGDLVVGGAWRCDHRWQGLDRVLPESLAGMRVLDVGSNAGYDPFMFSHRGASYVLACEPFDFYGQAEFLESVYGTGIDLRQIGWQQLDPRVHGQFDVVHCNGVLYHELHPTRMLRRLREMVSDGGTLLLGSMMLDDPELSGYARFVPGAYYGDPTWWWVPGGLALRWMLEAAGFVVEEEFGTSPGPPGEFPTLSAYLRATAGTAPHAVTATEVEERPTRMRFPEGHYYSPAPDLDELAAEPRRSQIWPAVPREAPGIDWRDGEQVSLFENVFAAQQRLPLAAEPTDDPRDYFTSNDQYPAFDAWLLEAMLQHLRPGRMIEVGSGFSSLVAARANRELLGGSVRHHVHRALPARLPHCTACRGSPASVRSRSRTRRSRRSRSWARATCSSSTPPTRSRRAGTCPGSSARSCRG